MQSWPYHPGVDDISDDDWLLPLQERRSLFGDLRFILRRELWTHRGLLYELTRRDIRVRYKQAVMGLVWAVLMPVLIVAAGALVRVAMAFVGGRPLVQFVASIDLQTNTGQGYLTVESVVWDVVERRERGRGPHGVSHVDDPDLVGTVNLHPRLRVETHGAFAQTADM